MRILFGFAALLLSTAPALAAPIQAGDYRLAFSTPIGELPLNVRLEHQGKVTFTRASGPLDVP